MPEPGTSGRKVELPDLVGCFLPLLLAGGGYALGSWLGGHWIGIVVAGGSVPLACRTWVRYSRTWATFESGCATTIVLLAFLSVSVPLLHRARERAREIKAEREAKQQAPPADAPTDGK